MRFWLGDRVGRLCLTANQVVINLAHGFESHPSRLKICSHGGIGIRTGLKILGPQGIGGSTPPVSII